MQRLSRDSVIFAIIALLIAFIFTRGLIERPGYTDAYYHFNAAARLVSGDGLTDAYLWTYIGAPDHLPAPSHLYWMPLTSLISAVGMRLFNAPGDYAAAQLPLTLMFWGTTLVGFYLGGKFGKSRRHAWVAGLLTLFSGYFTRFWGVTDTFAPYALVGSLALVLMGSGATTQSRRHLFIFWMLAGIFSGLGHLTRSDGLLLLIVGWLVLLLMLVRGKQPFSTTLLSGVLFTTGYLLVMAPWFIRNLDAVGTILPIGGTQSIWFTSYDDLFKYPANSTMQDFLAAGPEVIIGSRLEALSGNLGTFVAVEGLIAMTPLMLIGLWVRRKDRFLQGFALYALGIHVVMTFVFAYPGYRGGLLHSVTALIPFWAALGVIGLDSVIDWIAKRRRTWNTHIAKPLFSFMLVLLAVVLSIMIGSGNRVQAGTPRLYALLDDAIPEGSRVMINDPAQLYYFTGIGGVVIPNEPVDIVPKIAAHYDIDYLVVDKNIPPAFQLDPDTLPDFLIPVNVELSDTRLYVIDR